MITRGYVLLPHLLWRPFCLSAPMEEAVINLGVDSPGPYLLGQVVGLG